MVWRYRAINAVLCEMTGVMFGRRADVLVRLQQEGLFVVSLEMDVRTTFQRVSGMRRIPENELSDFFKDLGHMLEAGLTMTHILHIFKGSLPSLGIRAVCAQMQESLSKGMSLVQAMEGANIFPRLTLNAVSCAERSGQLIAACRLLSEYYQMAAVVKGQVIGALGYPLLILVFLCSALVYVTQKVVPSLASFLPSEAMQGGLTRFMLDLSHGLQDHWYWLLMVLVFLGMFAAIVSWRAREWRGLLLLHMPWVGSLCKDMDIAMCFFDIYILLKSGISLDAALREAGCAGVSMSRKKISQCAVFLVSGHTFAQALTACDYFPSLLIDMIKIGEETGAYVDYCERIYRLYYLSFERGLNTLASVVQPMLLGVCAACLMVFILAFLKPVYANLTHIGVM
ncbi:MAG: type II secretion system F family protein [Candidatus Omnitrophota bacterium]